MTQSMIEGLTSRLNTLRLASFSCKAEESTHFSPDLYFCWDKSSGMVDVSVTSVAGRLLNIDGKVKGSPKWFTLNIGLGAGRFKSGDAFGLVLAGSSDQHTTLYPFVRSAVGKERHDTQLSDAIKLDSSSRHMVLIHFIQAYEALASSENFHTLVIPMPKHDFRLEIEDLRLIHVPRSGGPHRQESTLASLAV